MRILRAILGLSIIVILISGCAKETPAPPPPEAIEYKVDANAEISKVTWYMSADSFLYIDVEVKNISAGEQAFNVEVSINDGPFFSAAVEAAKKVKAGAVQKYSTQSTVQNPYPEKLTIRVEPQ